MNQTVEVANEIGQNTAAVAQQGGMWNVILYCLFFIGILYVFALPNKRRMAEYQKMLANIKVGDRVLAAGIYGKVKKVNEKTIEVEIAKGVVIEMNKNAVVSVE